MSEPYNDEEFEKLKNTTENIRTVFGEWYTRKDFEEGIPLLKVCEDYGEMIVLSPYDYNSLIATVESLKEDNRLLGKLAKSKVETTRVQLDKNSELIEQNARLKTELDAALKRIEEYEAMEYPTIKLENANLAKTILSLTTENENRLQEIYKLRKPSKNDRRQHDLDYAARAPERRGR